MLKMALVVLRIRAAIPVVIMGHSGCGKTSLLSYLRQVCEIPDEHFQVLNVHAGISTDDIQQFMRNLHKHARSGTEVWGFLDEINTCEHLGVITDLLCHRTFDGQPLDHNIKLMACANPYEKRKLVAGKLQQTAGLGKVKFDQFAGLTYRVHPLPESMLDYVWDYGALRTVDETKYIKTIMAPICPEDILDTVIDLIVSSQQFIRNQDAFMDEARPWRPGQPPDSEREMHSVVSLRDVKRVHDLLKFFSVGADSLFRLRQEHCADARSPDGYKLSEGTQLYRDHQHVMQTLQETERGILLALAHCYYSRLEKAELRAGYRAMIALLMKKGRPSLDGTYLENTTASGKTESTFEKLLFSEQQDILNRMDFDLNPNIAHNGALMENVFISFVCIRIKLPVFIVGKPGNSKSLAMQLLNSSLRGLGSKDPLFKQMPGVNFVSFQGSEDCTSEGILQVFDKAERYLTDTQKQKDAPEVIPVVLLDEVGLAEISKHNPLKVLHSLLEPAFGETAKVAVVGISNWALDAAKMNRVSMLQ